MSSRYFCDKCGREQPKPAMQRYEVSVPTGRMVGTGTEMKQIAVADVCPSCESLVNQALADLFNVTVTGTRHDDFARTAASDRRNEGRPSGEKT